MISVAPRTLPILLGLVPALAVAAPRLDAPVVSADGAVLLSDTRDAGIYYYVPRDVALVGERGREDFRLLKAVALRNGSEVSRGGFLAITLGTHVPASDEEARWRRAAPKARSFLPLPVREAHCQLLLTRTGETPEEVAAARAPWSRRTFSIPLSGADATLLWRELGGETPSALVARVELVTHGYELHQNPGEEGSWEEATRTDVFSFPIEISRRTHPDRFELVDLGTKASFRFRELTVYLFDFANGLAEDVEQIVVEIQVATKRGERRTKLVIFAPDATPVHELSFDVPEEIGARYRYRLTRYTTAGKEVKGSWQESDASILDLSTYEIDVEWEDPV